MKLHRWEDIKARKLQQVAKANREILEADLRAIGEVLGKTQAEMAEIAEECRENSPLGECRDRRLSTLRRCVETLGGELEIVAAFGDRRVRLCL